MCPRRFLQARPGHLTLNVPAALPLAHRQAAAVSVGRERLAAARADVCGEHMDRFTSHSIAKPWHSFNPTIIPHPYDPEREFLVGVRVGNYYLSPEKKYLFPAGHTGIQTRNMIASIPVDFAAVDAGKAIQVKAPPPPHPYKAIQGEEDVRIIPGSDKPDGTVLVSFTSLEYTQHPLAQICIGTLDWKKGRLLNPVRLHGIDAADRAQKNWQCFMYDGVPHAIYSYQPLVAVRINRDTGECRIVSLDACTVINEWRGSSTLIPLPELSASGCRKSPANTETGTGGSRRWCMCPSGRRTRTSLPSSDFGHRRGPTFGRSACR